MLCWADGLESQHTISLFVEFTVLWATPNPTMISHQGSYYLRYAPRTGSRDSLWTKPTTPYGEMWPSYPCFSLSLPLSVPLIIIHMLVNVYFTHSDLYILKKTKVQQNVSNSSLLLLPFIAIKSYYVLENYLYTYSFKSQTALRRKL